ncbi:MAG: CHAD domain-containing protein [Thermoleophilia bacterium]|nr:CHAD domain-containing protein [Thermoleophilia bacterium]
MSAPEDPVSPPGSATAGMEDFRLAAGQVIELRVDQIVELSRGLLDVTDPAPIEQMWLALRRLRAALEIFRPCFTKAQFRGGRDEVKFLVRAVGARREIDSVIRTLEEIGAEMGQAESAGLTGAVDQLRRDQADANRRLAQAVHGRRLQAFSFRFEELAGLALGPDREVAEGEYRSARYLPPETVKLVARRLNRLRDAASGALEPDAVADQKRMRVAAERLRYALELTGDSLGTQAHTARRAARALQEILTEIWGCNLAIPVVRDKISQLEKEDVRTVLTRARGTRELDPVLVQAAPNRASYRGLELSLVHLGAGRQMLFDRLKRLWMEQSRQGVWVALESSLGAPAR